MLIQPYLTFNGNCREAFEYYHKVLGGSIEVMQTHGESPAKDFTPPEWHDAIIHARLNTGGQVLMGSDAPPDYQEKMGGFSISVTVSDEQLADRIFAGLAEGGSVTMPLAETFWAPKFGMCTDRFSVHWMVNYVKGA